MVTEWRNFVRTKCIRLCQDLNLRALERVNDLFERFILLNLYTHHNSSSFNLKHHKGKSTSQFSIVCRKYASFVIGSSQNFFYQYTFPANCVFGFIKTKKQVKNTTKITKYLKPFWSLKSCCFNQDYYLCVFLY